MKTTDSTATRDEIVAWGRDRFFRALAELDPASVLDVGCGSGDLLRRCRDAGIPARGVEPSPTALGGPVEPGLSRLCADALRLPFAAGAVDWVTMRFVPHHLADPARAFREALRVARSGLLVAEPWFDPRVPSQRTAWGVDAWVKRQHRRAGRVHEEVLDVRALVEALPDEPAVDVALRIESELRGRSPEDVEAETAPLARALPGDHPDRDELERLVAACRRTGVSWNGSLILVVRQRTGSRDRP